MTGTIDFVKLAQDVRAHGSRVMLLFARESLEVREEVESVFDFLESGLEHSDVMTRRGLSTVLHDVTYNFCKIDEAITDLRDGYGIEDTQPLEAIRDQLGDWLREHGQGPTPGGSSSLSL